MIYKTQLYINIHILVEILKHTSAYSQSEFICVAPLCIIFHYNSLFGKTIKTEILTFHSAMPYL